MALESLPQLSASFSSCRRFHSAVIQLSCSNLGRAGYKDPSLTCNASPETCFSRWLTAKPFIGSSARIFSNSISNVPCTRSEGLLMFVFSVTEMTVLRPISCGAHWICCCRLEEHTSELQSLVPLVCRLLF